MIKMAKIYTVHELSALLKGTLETKFPFIWVRGQVSNLSRPGSGHLYFTLKDEHAAIDAVWFKAKHRGSGEFNPLTGEVFSDGQKLNLAETLEVGEEILCAGQITMYTPQGRLQLVVELAQQVGIGTLQQEFEKLKEKLLKQGYFAQERKRPLPLSPKRVSIITAPTGAVIHDFLRIAENRGTGGEIRIYPALVQGDNAPASIVSAVEKAAKDSWADLIVLIRGGGSLEDLWAFNSEEVATAIFKSPVPVITGIGHEPDVSIADLVADMRAATPTHAAQLIWDERIMLVQQIDELELAAQRMFKALLEKKENLFSETSRYLTHFSPLSTLQRTEEQLAHTIHQLYLAWNKNWENSKSDLKDLAYGLTYALTPADFELNEKNIFTLFSHIQLLVRDNLNKFETSLIPETLLSSLINQTLMRYENILPLSDTLLQLLTRNFEKTESRLNLNTSLLEACNPLQPLNRGYAVVTGSDGKILRSAKQSFQGQEVNIRLKDGSLEATINKRS